MIQRRTPLQRKTPLRSVARKTYHRLNRYRKVKAEFLNDHQECAVKQPGCKGVATIIHHGEGRCGDLLFDKTKFVPVCDGPCCHTWVETHPIEAKELNLSFSRLNNK